MVLKGNNGAGKTSIMEAVYAATRGRSFRPVPLAETIRNGCDAAEIMLMSESAGDAHHVGARFGRKSRELHLDGRAVHSVAEAGAMVPVEYLGGAAHRLVDGPPRDRRRFMDWGLFHVEPRFLGVWRLWRRAQRQRNEWLRRGDYPASAGWTSSVAEYGEALSQLRAQFIAGLSERLVIEKGLGMQEKASQVNFSRGWRGDSLRKAFEATKERERRVGHAVVGPQHDDWLLQFNGLSANQLSRGQSKLASFFLWRALGKMMREVNRSAVLLADDFLADLDQNSIRLAISALNGITGQVWLAIQGDFDALELPGEALTFHVEPGNTQLYIQKSS